MYYYLVTGRWFKAKSLKGPWLAATGKLPNDFAKIPSDHEKGYVLVSVPNTEDAKAAVEMCLVDLIPNPRISLVKMLESTSNCLF